MRALFALILFTAACGDNDGSPLAYDNPKPGGKLRLIKSKTASAAENEVVLDLVVGDAPLTGYSAGFNLPVGHRLVRMTEFIPATALDPGTTPPATRGSIPVDGPLADHLVTGISQKATGPGAIMTDATLPPNTVLYTMRLEKVLNAPEGIVFDGTASDFHLPSGGMRDRTGTTVVEANEVAIGKLEINR